MAYPRKFKHLLELDRRSKKAPPQVWLTYSVCGVTAEACGWHGWVLEAAFNTSERTSGPDHLEPGAYEQSCPRCGREVFRTAASYRFQPSADQSPALREGVDYEVAPMVYDD